MQYSTMTERQDEHQTKEIPLSEKSDWAKHTGVYYELETTGGSKCVTANARNFLPAEEPESTAAEYQQKTYKELSGEFTQAYLMGLRAFELIPIMYNRLTLVDKLSHKKAVRKIHNDHQHLAGFTERNIRRFLPEDNPHVQHRLRTSRPKNDDRMNGELIQSAKKCLQNLVCQMGLKLCKKRILS